MIYLSYYSFQLLKIFILKKFLFIAYINVLVELPNRENKLYEYKFSCFKLPGSTLLRILFVSSELPGVPNTRETNSLGSLESRSASSSQVHIYTSRNESPDEAINTARHRHKKTRKEEVQERDRARSKQHKEPPHK